MPIVGKSRDRVSDTVKVEPAKNSPTKPATSRSSNQARARNSSSRRARRATREEKKRSVPTAFSEEISGNRPFVKFVVADRRGVEDNQGWLVSVLSSGEKGYVPFYSAIQTGDKRPNRRRKKQARHIQELRDQVAQLWAIIREKFPE